VVVLPFKQIPLALDRGWGEVFWTLFNKVLLIALIPAMIVVTAFFGVAVLDLGEFVFVYVPYEILHLGDTIAESQGLVNSVINSLGNSITIATIWWISKFLLAYFLGKFVWNSPNLLNEYLGNLLAARLHRSAPDEELEEKKARLTKF
jgi:hypothetical protein